MSRSSSEADFREVQRAARMSTLLALILLPWPLVLSLTTHVGQDQLALRVQSVAARVSAFFFQSGPVDERLEIGHTIVSVLLYQCLILLHASLVPRRPPLDAIRQLQMTPNGIPLIRKCVFPPALLWAPVILAFGVQVSHFHRTANAAGYLTGTMLLTLPIWGLLQSILIRLGRLGLIPLPRVIALCCASIVLMMLSLSLWTFFLLLPVWIGVTVHAWHTVDRSGSHASASER